MGMAFFMLFAGLAQGEESGAVYHDNLVSLRKNAVVTIGGELLVDLQHRRANTSMADPGRKLRATDHTVRTARMRIAADVHPNVGAMFKINFNPDSEPCRSREILEEAYVVLKSVGGTGLDFFTGMGRAPYGQDVTLGMIQSYHHSANLSDSPEGNIFIVEPPEDARAAAGAPGEGRVLAPMRPGQFERSIMTGVSYQWDDRWKVEIAMFRPDYANYRPRLSNRDGDNRGGFDSDVALAGRLWFMPFEDLVLEASGMWLRSKAMGNTNLRTDLPVHAKGKKDAYSLSFGFDWRRAPWMVFGEYQHGWDWNFSEGYDTDTWQLGMARNFGPWRLGAMGEALRISDKQGRKTVDNYYKLSLNIRYEFSSALFILAEYGHEWFRRDYGGSLAEKRRGDFFGVRLGFSF